MGPKIIQCLKVSNKNFIFIAIFISLASLDWDPNTSVLALSVPTEEIPSWIERIENGLDKIFQDYIEFNELQLDKLKKIRERHLVMMSKHQDLSNPLRSFARINKIVSNMDKFSTTLLLMNRTIVDFEKRFDQLYEDEDIPDKDGVIEMGISFIRLQAFYNISVDDMLNRPEKYFKNSKKISYDDDLTEFDYFKLGTSAYQDKEFSRCFEWLLKAFEWKSNSYMLDYHSGDFNYTLLLDYLSYSAYKTHNLESAIKFTKLWLEAQPGHKRATKNLAYYEKDLTKTTTPPPKDSRYNYDKRLATEFNVVDVDTYKLQLDHHLRELCIKPYEPDKRPGASCYTKFALGKSGFLPSIKIEQLFPNSSILRVYDIINDKEAEILKQLAKDGLVEAVVFSISRGRNSHFRDARTRFLNRDAHVLIDEIDDRFYDIFGIYAQEAEGLQIVNYGPGGYYGPHKDTIKIPEGLDFPEGLMRKAGHRIAGRVATIIIYMNEVEAGGATIFPMLNLTVEPIKNSAVFWLNLNEDGEVYENVTHAACPILSGSKWIATRWAREKQNIFIRPCRLQPMN